MTTTTTDELATSVRDLALRLSGYLNLGDEFAVDQAVATRDHHALVKLHEGLTARAEDYREQLEEDEAPAAGYGGNLFPDPTDRPARDLFAPDTLGRCLPCRAGSHRACRGRARCGCPALAHSDLLGDPDRQETR